MLKEQEAGAATADVC